MEMIDGKILPAALFHPRIVSMTWLKHWGLQCGRCKRDFHRFAFFGKPKCPYCGTRNVPQFDCIC